MANSAKYKTDEKSMSTIRNATSKMAMAGSDRLIVIMKMRTDDEYAENRKMRSMRISRSSRSIADSSPIVARVSLPPAEESVPLLAPAATPAVSWSVCEWKNALPPSSDAR